MRILGRGKRDPDEEPQEPELISQRWVIILAVSGAVGGILSVGATPAVGVPASIAMVALLHRIMK